jgi:hypothetical protein
MVLASNIAMAQYTDVINSNRPGESMSAFSLGHNVFQTELGFFGINEKHKYLESNAIGMGSDFVLRYGLFLDELEVVTNFQYQIDKIRDSYDTINRLGFKKILFGAKYLIYDPNKLLEEKNEIKSWKKAHSFSFRDCIPAVSVYAGTNINIANSPFNNYFEPTLSPKLMLITQNQFPRSYVLITNLFYDRFLSAYQNYGYVITITKGLNPNWTVFLENKAVQGDYYSDGIFTAGAAHLFGRNIQIDVSISKNYKTTPDLLYGGIGFSWRFDANYKETWVRDTKADRVQEKLDKARAKKEKAMDDAQYKKDKAQYKIDKAAYDKEMKAEKEANKNLPKANKETKNKNSKETKNKNTTNNKNQKSKDSK